MSRVVGVSIVMLVAASARGQSPSTQLEPLVSAIADARVHAASLAEHTGSAPRHGRAAPSPEEKDASSAVVTADHELNDLMESSPGVLPRMVDTEVLSDLNAAHDGLAAYAQARTHGNTKAMRAAARRTVEALDRADAHLDPHKPYHIMEP